jgi:hypothetical protein
LLTGCSTLHHPCLRLCRTRFRRRRSRDTGARILPWLRHTAVPSPEFRSRPGHSRGMARMAILLHATAQSRLLESPTPTGNFRRMQIRMTRRANIRSRGVTIANSIPRRSPLFQGPGCRRNPRCRCPVRMRDRARITEVLDSTRRMPIMAHSSSRCRRSLATEVLRVRTAWPGNRLTTRPVRRTIHLSTRNSHLSRQPSSSLRMSRPLTVHNTAPRRLLRAAPCTACPISQLAARPLLLLRRQVPLLAKPTTPRSSKPSAISPITVTRPRCRRSLLLKN